MRSTDEVYERLLAREEEYRLGKMKNKASRRILLAAFCGLILALLLGAAVLHAATKPRGRKNDVTEYADDTRTKTPVPTGSGELAYRQNESTGSCQAEISEGGRSAHLVTKSADSTGTATINASYWCIDLENYQISEYRLEESRADGINDITITTEADKAIVNVQSDHAVYDGGECVYSEHMTVPAP